MMGRMSNDGDEYKDNNDYGNDDNYSLTLAEVITLGLVSCQS